MKIISSTHLKELDKYTIANEPITSIDLMERAAHELTRTIMRRWDASFHIVVFAGPGNNGGDGAAIARILKTKGVDAELFCLGNPEKYSEGMRAQKKIAENYGVCEVKNPDFRE